MTDKLERIVEENHGRRQKGKTLLIASLIILAVFSLNLFFRPVFTGNVVSEVKEAGLTINNHLGKNSANLGQEIMFYTQYLDEQGNSIINADCLITTESKTDFMIYDSATQTYRYSLSFFKDGFNHLSVSCSKDGGYSKKGEVDMLIMQDCVIPKDDLIIKYNTRLCAGKYGIIDKDKDGVIIIQNPDATLDCNGASIIGDGRGTGILLPDINYRLSGNCEVFGYKTPISVKETKTDFLTGNVVFESPKLSVTMQEAYPGDNTVPVSNTNIALTGIGYTAQKYVSNIDFSFEKITNPPSDYNMDNIYEYDAINVRGISNDDVSKIWFVFRVKKSWFSDNDLNNETLGISVYASNRWVKQSYETYFEDADYTYYKVYVASFNQLVVINAEKNVHIEPVIEKPAPIPEPIIDFNQSTALTPDDKGLTSANFSLLFILGPAIVILILLGLLYELKFAGDSYMNIDEAQNFVSAQLSEGISEEEIETELKSNGWPKKIVSDLLEHVKLLPKKEEEIQRYVSKRLVKGIPKQRITQELKNAGWQEEVIKEYVK